ncbi:2-oxoisovalerate dehydrogenase E1 component [Dokdonia sp. Hel_I_63]|uniref:alpha-ketoacid dehydrogenase subunit alpha/beta n=1 Tax=unclassified Dokdonia TaxID=2615033 RepID=UPI00020A7C8F|nr:MULTISPECIES: dehydrogenase E1 component subunit alpha/beta [unclassified Dokdonia]AEE20496.1 dehydrogenase E1 component [Dokdonia sp. 4H-3-7-5]TVZ23248.1 2-oxoisovalerate dehydrogenase E1 component [Dokdonia sp. Hel_I_63]
MATTTKSSIPFIYNRASLDNDTLLRLYRAMLKPRLIEERMLILLRQGKVSKWFSGIGQEAISVGVTAAMKPEEYILPMHRNLGVFTTREIPLYRLFTQWQGKMSGFTKGRDRSFHFGTQEFNIVGMISHLGPQLGVADGIALAHKLRNENAVTAVFTGEGGTSEGDFHEALNVASVWQLPVLFCIENNGYGLSTPTSEQYNCEHLADRAKGYGMESHIIDGNNILEIYTKILAIAEDIRNNPRPVLIEFKTFRMRGHEEASGTKYVPEELMEAWGEKDPLLNFEKYLIHEGILSQETKDAYEVSIKEEITEHLDKAYAEESITPNLETEMKDVYAPFSFRESVPSEDTEELRLIDAISQGLRQSMEKYDDLVIMGQDVAEYGGVFKITDGFVEQFGRDRVRNTPICESAIVETAMGLAINGKKALMEMQFSDFATSGFNPIVNYLAKSHYRWSQPADVVIRMPCGAGVGAGPFHSQTNEAWFTHTPGLKVVYPAFPADAKGLLATAIEDPNPVLFFEHKKLYRSIRQEVPTNYYTLPLGKASLVREGEQVTIITYGAGVHWAIELLDSINVSADLLDLRTLQPLDKEAIITSVRKTGRVLLLTEDSAFGSVMSDISAMIMEECFESLDAPVRRVASIDTPIPFDAELEKQYLPVERLATTLQELLDY